jgi:hypothetical protein
MLTRILPFVLKDTFGRPTSFLLPMSSSLLGSSCTDPRLEVANLVMVCVSQICSGFPPCNVLRLSLPCCPKVQRAKGGKRLPMFVVLPHCCRVIGRACGGASLTCPSTNDCINCLRLNRVLSLFSTAVRAFPVPHVPSPTQSPIRNSRQHLQVLALHQRLNQLPAVLCVPSAC